MTVALLIAGAGPNVAKTYSNGCTLKVTPEDRTEDVIHFLITGHLLGGRSLDGVAWEQVEGSSIKKRAEALRRSMAENK